MRVYPTPDFSRAIEDFPVRQQNLAKALYNNITRLTSQELYAKGWLHKLSGEDSCLHVLRLHELRVLCRIDADHKGEYMILLEAGVMHKRE